MRNLFVKCFSCALIVLMIFAYNEILAQRANAEEIARLRYELETAQAQLRMLQEEDTLSEPHLYTNGTYEGTAVGFGGDITVEVTVEADELRSIVIISADQEDALYLMLATSVIDRILNEQSTEVDIVSGATFSSTGIREAVKNALEKAVLPE